VRYHTKIDHYSSAQCCGSGMFYPGFQHFSSRIPDHP
jgi:hypothetical protein